MSREEFLKIKRPVLFAYRKDPYTLYIKGDTIGDAKKLLSTPYTRTLWEFADDDHQFNNVGDCGMIDCDTWDNDREGLNGEEQGYIVFAEFEAKEIVRSMIDQLGLDADYDWLNAMTIRRGFQPKNGELPYEEYGYENEELNRQKLLKEIGCDQS